MSNVRDYFKEREKRQTATSAVNYKERIRSHRLTIFYRIMLLILLVAVICVFVFVQWRDKVYTEGVVTHSAPVSIVQGTTVKNLGGNVLIYSKDGASCLDTKGNVIWNRTFEMQSPKISICQDVAAIGDYNGRTIYVMNKTETLGDINTNMPIRSFCVSANGIVAAALDDADVTRINIYNAKGNTEEPLAAVKASMTKSGYPISFSLSPDGKLLAISYLHVESGEMKSTVAFFNFGEVGKNGVDNYVSGYDYLDSVVPLVQFMDLDSAFAVSDDRIIFFSGSERPTNVASNLLEEKVQGVYYNENYVGLVFRNQSGGSVYRLDVYNDSGTKVHSQLFDMNYSDIIFNKEQIMIYNDSECRISTMKGIDKYKGSFEKSVSLMLPTSSIYKYVNVTSNSIDTLELK